MKMDYVTRRWMRKTFCSFAPSVFFLQLQLAKKQGQQVCCATGYRWVKFGSCHQNQLSLSLDKRNLWVSSYSFPWYHQEQLCSLFISPLSNSRVCFLRCYHLFWFFSLKYFQPTLQFNMGLHFDLKLLKSCLFRNFTPTNRGQFVLK